MRDKEVWRDIPEFTPYMVSSHGRVMNGYSEAIKSPNINQQGIVSVLLMQGRAQFRKSVAVLVAEAFLPDPPKEHFDTPIHLDGDKSNCRADNLAWRPRWFAVAYHKQFYDGSARFGFKDPIEVIQTGEIFDTTWAAAMAFGMLNKDIFMSVCNDTQVFPQGYRFRTV